VTKDGDSLVLQYELKMEKAHTCGGMYIKLLADSADLDLDKFSGDTDYTIMFGPDKCATTNKVHFILKHESPLNKAIEEKHANDPPKALTDLKTHLYTLVIKPDNSYEYFVDMESQATGNLLDSMTPSVNPPKQIDDPTDSKPEDWVDEAKIDDPEASKPDDWDEDAPMEIVDASKSMPEDWDEDAPEKIADPSAQMPDDWDEDEDGDWEAPTIPNPKCDTGCGKWPVPMIPNPDYKGKWYAPQIDNPAYKGEWKAKQIDNPDFYEDLEPYKVRPFSAVGIELWTMTNGIFFDNILITRDAAVAEDFATKTWKVVSKLETEKEESKKSSTFKTVMKSAEHNFLYASVKLEELGVPEAYAQVTLVGLASVLVVITFIWILSCCCSSDDIDGAESDDDDDDDEPSAPQPEPEAEEEEKKKKDKGLTQRVTRSMNNPAKEEAKEEPAPAPAPKKAGKKAKKRV